MKSAAIEKGSPHLEPACLGPVERPSLHNERAALAEFLDGQVATIPNLYQLFPGWRFAVNSSVDLVNKQIDQWLENVDLPDNIKRSHRRKGDYASIAAAWYPDSAPERLFVMSKLLYWMFVWDDMIDTGGRLANDSTGTIACCTRTKVAIDDVLSGRPSIAHTDPLISMLCPTLLEIRSNLAPQSVQRLRDDLIMYVDGVGRQQTVRSRRELPSATDNLSMRVGDVGALPFITASEYVMQFTLPHEIYLLPNMQELIRLSAELVVLVNELVSLQKEACDGQVENVVLLLAFQERISLRRAVNRVVDVIAERVERFGLEESLLKATLASQKNDTAVEQYIAAAKDVVTGNTWWSYNCGRYFKPEQFGGHGEVNIQAHFSNHLKRIFAESTKAKTNTLGDDIDNMIEEVSRL